MSNTMRYISMFIPARSAMLCFLCISCLKWLSECDVNEVIDWKGFFWTLSVRCSIARNLTSNFVKGQKTSIWDTMLMSIEKTQFLYGHFKYCIVLSTKHNSIQLSIVYCFSCYCTNHQKCFDDSLINNKCV